MTYYYKARNGSKAIGFLVQFFLDIFRVGSKMWTKTDSNWCIYSNNVEAL